MGIIDNGPGNTNNVTDPWNHYNGKIGIETRGNSTQGFDKKTYSIELWKPDGSDTSQALLGMPSEEDWILHAMVIDKTQLRIPMTFSLAQQMGHYASRYRYCELVIDGAYQGLYILTEKIKRDNDRVDIAKLNAVDIAGDQVTGGYILRIDWLDDPAGFASDYNSLGGVPMFFQWYYPKAVNIQPEQAAYIQNYMRDFEDALFSPNFQNGTGARYNNYMNETSFADFLIINEISKNSDGYKLSSYLYKDKQSKGGKFVMGPIWDFDQSYGVSEVCSCSDPTGWTYTQSQTNCEDYESMPLWWETLMTDSVFTNHLKCRWDTLRQGPLHLDTMYAWIDANRAMIQPAINRNFTQWDDMLGEYIWYEPAPVPADYEGEITYFKNWLSQRMAWLDNNMPGNCQFDVVGAEEFLDDPLTIVMYPNPSADGVVNLSIEGTPTAMPNEVEVYDLTGRKVLGEPVQNQQLIAMNCQTLNAGVYLVRVSNGTSTWTQKLVIE